MQKSVVAVALLATLLAGCGPSAADIEAALKRSVGPANSVMGGLFGQSTQIEIKEVKKLGCEKSSPAGYRCDVEWTATVPVLGDTRHTGTFDFIKGSDGWTVSK